MKKNIRFGRNVAVCTILGVVLHVGVCGAAEVKPKKSSNSYGLTSCDAVTGTKDVPENARLVPSIAMERMGDYLLANGVFAPNDVIPCRVQNVIISRACKRLCAKKNIEVWRPSGATWVSGGSVSSIAECTGAKAPSGWTRFDYLVSADSNKDYYVKSGSIYSYSNMGGEDSFLVLKSGLSDICYLKKTASVDKPVATTDNKKSASGDVKNTETAPAATYASLIGKPCQAPVPLPAHATAGVIIKNRYVANGIACMVQYCESGWKADPATAAKCIVDGGTTTTPAATDATTTPATGGATTTPAAPAATTTPATGGTTTTPAATDATTTPAAGVPATAVAVSAEQASCSVIAGASWDVKLNICVCLQSGYVLQNGACVETAESLAARKVAEDVAARKAKIEGMHSKLKKAQDAFKVTVWKNEEGKFNTARLASDSIAGAVLGTTGALVTNSAVKKHQVEDGFEAIQCAIGNDIVADWGETFRIDEKHHYVVTEHGLAY